MTEQAENIRILVEWLDLPFDDDEETGLIYVKTNERWILWNPYTSLDRCDMLIQHARSLGWHYEVGDNHTMAEYYCLLYRTDGEDRREVWGYGSDENRAICVAVLRLMEGVVK